MKKKNPSERIGLLGGTFNPIHNGHVGAALSARERTALDRVLFIPSFIPPHKDTGDIEKAEHRFKMVELAVRNRPGFEASLIELEAGDTSYSIVTLGKIKKIHPTAQLFFLLGIDAFLDIRTWKHYERILEQCSFIVLSRPPFSLDAARDVLDPGLHEAFRDVGEEGLDLEKEKAEGVIYLLPIPEIDISSSDIRLRLSEGRSINGLVPPDVERYIRDNELYQSKQRSRDKTVPFSKDSLTQEVQAAVQAAQEKMAEDMILLDLKELSSFTDFFLIMNGRSTKQNTALCDHIERVLRKMRMRPLSIEGRSNGEWILMDYGYLIIHIFSDETRAYYSLEKLWGDAPRLQF